MMTLFSHHRDRAWGSGKRTGAWHDDGRYYLVRTVLGVATVALQSAIVLKVFGVI